MKKTFFLVVIAILGIQHLSAQFSFKKEIKGNGNLIKFKKQVPEYEEISVTSSFDITLYQAQEGNLEISVEENLKDYLNISSVGGKLKIEWSKNVNINHKKPVKISVPVESINKIMMTGSGNIQNNFTLKEKNLDIVLTGSGNIFLQLETNHTVSRLTGSGDIKLTGKTTELQSIVTGSGNFSGYDFIADDVTANVSGSGNNDVYASQKIDATVTGSGNINYKGHPKSDATKVVGSGSIKMK